MLGDEWESEGEEHRMVTVSIVYVLALRRWRGRAWHSSRQARRDVAKRSI